METGNMPKTLIRKRILDALQYPTSIIRKEIDVSTCKHGGNFHREDAECITCYQTPECEWLVRHDNDTNTTVLDDSQLLATLQFAGDYIHARLSLQRHTPTDCPCEGCRWWRSASDLLRQAQAVPA